MVELSQNLRAEKPCAENDWGVVPDGIRVRFMGTGAADWLTARKEEEGGYEFRRWSSALFDNLVLVDFTHFNYPSVVADKPPEGQSVWLCHLAKTLHPHQKVLDQTLPAPLKAASDCLEVVLK